MQDGQPNATATAPAVRAPSFLENLPENCPPETSTVIGEQLTVYRFTRTSPPTLDDFRSQRAENPTRTWPDVPECVARGVSVFEDLSVARKKIRGASMAMRQRFICEVTLSPGAGHITPSSKSTHRTWWPLRDYPILSACRVLT